MKQLLLICAVVALVGCGEWKAAEAKAAAELRAFEEARAKALAEAKEQSTIVEITDPIVERAIRAQLNYQKVTVEGELTKADLEKVTRLNLRNNKLTEIPKGLEKLTKLEWLWLSENKLTSVKGLEKLTKLKRLELDGNQLTDVKGLEKLTRLKMLFLYNNPDLTKAQIAELRKALPKPYCKIASNPKK